MPAPSPAQDRGAGPGQAYRALHAEVPVGLGLWLHGELGLQDPLHWHVLLAAARTVGLALGPLPAPLSLFLNGWQQQDMCRSRATHGHRGLGPTQVSASA